MLSLRTPAKTVSRFFVLKIFRISVGLSIYLFGILFFWLSDSDLEPCILMQRPKVHIATFASDAGA